MRHPAGRWVGRIIRPTTARCGNWMPRCSNPAETSSAAVCSVGPSERKQRAHVEPHTGRSFPWRNMSTTSPPSTRSRPGRCGRSRSRDSPCCSSATARTCTRWARPVRMPAARSPRACAAATAWSALGTRRRFPYGPARYSILPPWIRSRATRCASRMAACS
jgi:hypothetical protein